MGTRGRRGLRVVVALAAIGAALAPASAQALPSSTPDNAAVANGPVNAIARGGGITYIGGTFTELQVNQAGFASVNAATGANTGLPPVARSGPTLSVGGSFSSIGGVPRRGYAQFTEP